MSEDYFKNSKRIQSHVQFTCRWYVEIFDTLEEDSSKGIPTPGVKVLDPSTWTKFLVLEVKGISLIVCLAQLTAVTIMKM